MRMNILHDLVYGDLIERASRRKIISGSHLKVYLECGWQIKGTSYRPEAHKTFYVMEWPFKREPVYP